MSLQQGPTDSLITSVAHANFQLAALKVECQKQEEIHRQFISNFLAEFALDEIRQIPKRYRSDRLPPLVESANLFNLTVNSSFTIIVHGIESLETHFNQCQPFQFNNLVKISNRSLMVIAKTKLQVENNVADFIRNHRKIEKLSPTEDRDKAALEQTALMLELDIKTLSEMERLTIAYYETVLKAEAVFKELTDFKNSMNVLREHLKTLKPNEEHPAPAAINWGNSFDGAQLFDGNDLARVLQERLSLGGSESAAEPDWDSLSLPPSKRSSLLQPADASAMNKALLHQFDQHVTASPTAPQDKVAPQIGETPRPDL